MSATATAPIRPTSPAASTVETQPVNLRRSIASEWIKFRTLRSSWAVLGAAVLGMLVIGLIVAYNTRHLTKNQDANDLVPSAVLQGFFLAQLLIGALGVLYVSGEYSTGMIRSTFAAVPKRLPVLWAKLVVFLAVTAVAMVAITFVTFLASQALIGHYRMGYSLSDPGVIRVLLGTAFFLTVAGAIGGMLAWIVRSTPGALVSYFALMLVLPVVFGSLFGTWGKHIAEYLPTQAAAAFSESQPESPHLSSGTGVVVLLAWLAVGAVAAVVTMTRRDA